MKYMKFLKNFEKFVESVETLDPSVKPKVNPPKTKPGLKPNRPSPIRRDRPSVVPKPKAVNDQNQKLATFDDVAKRFINLMNKRGEDIKKFINKK